MMQSFKGFSEASTAAQDATTQQGALWHLRVGTCREWPSHTTLSYLSTTCATTRHPWPTSSRVAFEAADNAPHLRETTTRRGLPLPRKHPEGGREGSLVLCDAPKSLPTWIPSNIVSLPCSSSHTKERKGKERHCHGFQCPIPSQT